MTGIRQERKRIGNETTEYLNSRKPCGENQREQKRLAASVTMIMV
tara:strand:+ start:59 stop:193 length:135 start_codon:yes stop_codon:yes gene_type:complete